MKNKHLISVIYMKNGSAFQGINPLTAGAAYIRVFIFS